MNRQARALFLTAVMAAAAYLLPLVAIGFLQPVLADRQQAALRRPEVKIAGFLAEGAGNEWRIGDTAVHVDAAASAAGELDTGSYVVAKGELDEQGALWSNTVSLLPQPEMDSEILRSDTAFLPGEAQPTVEFQDVIQAIEPQYWVVGTRLVFITNDTSILGQPEIGALAAVKGTLTYGNIVLATSIKVTLSGAFAEVQFEGPIESITADEWTVGGKQVLISPVTVVEGVTPAIGMLAEVQGLLQPNDSVLAQHISVFVPGQPAFPDLEGLVEQMEAGQWMVGGRPVLIESNTFIDDSRAPAEVGMWARVWVGSERAGVAVALRIRLSRPF